jgi:hypothetical protein
MSDIRPPILIVVRASPIRDRTAALLESIANQKATDTVKVVVLSQRRIAAGSWPPGEGVEYLDAVPHWEVQVLRLAEASGCRWLVLPSSVDRYLPGAFEAVVELGAAAGRTVVGACQVGRDDAVVRIGPEPFRFDYFALLSGFNYIAPGATFIDIGRLVETGGFHARFTSCSTYEYLLRTGAADGVVSCPVPIVETVAEPFPGIPSDWAALHASEALLVTLHYNRYFVTSGAAMGLLSALADHLEPYQHTGFHDDQVLKRLAGAAADLKQRYLEELRLPAAPPGVAEAPQGELRTGVKSRVKRVMPQPIWDTLRRVKRAYLALRSPLY